MNLWGVIPTDAELRGKWMNDTLRASIARQIRQLRESRGMSQEELAKGLDTSQGSIARLENPRRCNPTTTTLVRIAEFFDVGLIVKFSTISEFLLLITADGVYIKSYQQEAEEIAAALAKDAPPEGVTSR